MVSFPLYAHVVLRRGCSILLNGMLYILYCRASDDVPVAFTKPESVESSFCSPWPYSVSLLASRPTLNVQFFQLIESFASKLLERYSEWIFGTRPMPCAWNVVW